MFYWIVVSWLFTLLARKSLSNDEVIHGLKGKQLPPPNSAYRKFFDKCGIPNCVVNCDRKKRSILKPPRYNDTVASGDDYIMNGGLVPEFTYPWVAKVQHNNGQTNGDPWETVCTATLISSRHALTARHCMIFPNLHEMGRSYYTKYDTQLVFGDKPENKIVAHVTEVHNPSKIHTSEHDLSILEFQEITFTDNLRPICLPIDGTLESDDVVLAGYGHSGFYYDPKDDSKITTYGEGLHEIRGYKLTHEGITNPRKYNSASVNMPGKSKTNPQTSHFQLIHPEGMASEVCTGDSGGPVMWESPEGKYVLLGIIAGGIGSKSKDGYGCELNKPTNTKERVTVFVTKVSHFLLKILDFMSSDRQHSTCQHADCNPKKNTEEKTTFMLEVKDGIHKINTRLAPPCIMLTELDPYNHEENTICPVGLEADRHRIINLQEFRALQETSGSTRWRYCSPCDKSNNSDENPLAWSDVHYFDEITAGSFLLPQYGGLESKYDQLTKLIPDRSSIKPHADICDIENSSGYVRCQDPSNSEDFLQQCIFPENICDGRSDCASGWDESPHLCIGKCDYWFQYQYPNIAYSTVRKHTISFESAASAKECHKRCVKEASCTHFNFFGGYNAESSNIEDYCVTMSDPINPTTAPMARSNKEKFVTRGIKQCQKESKNTRQCTPVNGIPYRNGIFLIQAYDGKFLSSIPGEKTHVRVAAQLFHDIVKKDHMRISSTPDPDFWKISSKNGNLTSNPSEWIFRFHQNEVLYESYFEIFSGFGNEIIFSDRFLATQNEPIAFLKEMTGPNDKIQKWYFKPVRKERGFTEVKIYTKNDDGVRRYLTLPDDVAGDREYHYTKDNAEPNKFVKDGERSIKDVGTETEWDLKKWKLSEKGNQEDAIQTQVFRIWECDYGLEHGFAVRGQQKKVYEKEKIRDLIEEKKTEMELQGRLEEFFTNMFGISHGRIQKILMEDSLDELITTIDEELNKSSSMHDYAGRMRIHYKEFTNMVLSWKLYILEVQQNGANTACYKDKLCAFLRKRVNDGFITDDLKV